MTLSAADLASRTERAIEQAREDGCDQGHPVTVPEGDVQMDQRGAFIWLACETCEIRWRLRL